MRSSGRQTGKTERRSKGRQECKEGRKGEEGKR